VAIAAQKETVTACLRPLMEGHADISEIRPQEITDTLSLIAGDISLFELEPFLSAAWETSPTGNAYAAKAVTAFDRMLQEAASRSASDVILVDLAPTLGGINRTALAATDHVIIPMVPDALAVRGLPLVGQVLAQWQDEWESRHAALVPWSRRTPFTQLDVMGYVLLKVRAFQGVPIRSMQRWMNEIPSTFHQHVARQPGPAPHSAHEDPYCLAILREYSYLLPMAAEALKPVFKLRPADGAVGSYMAATLQAGIEFRALADTISSRVGLQRQTP
jgi:hypothetical protein